MKPPFSFFLLIACMMLLSCETSAQNNINKISWSIAAKLPAIAGMQKQLGVAGSFTGVSNGVLLIAGGSNFADGAKPWEGGKKIYKDDIYVLQRNDSEDFNWIVPETKRLKQKAAYGASTTITGGVVCAGGETERAGSSKNVFMMSWDKASHDVVIKQLPLLPIPVANACMTSIGNTIYLAGGESNGKPTAAFFMINLDHDKVEWLPLPPMPIAMSHSVAVAQSNGKYSCIYIIGGRSSTPSGISTLQDVTFCYDPKYKKWITLSNVGDGAHTTTISAATGVADGDHHILLIGGDKGDLFHKIETWNATIANTKDNTEKQRISKEKLGLLNNHPGFSKDVYEFNTLANTWKKIGELPFYGQVTTTAVKWNNEIFIPGGEIKPGTRTPNITVGRFDQ